MRRDAEDTTRLLYALAHAAAVHSSDVRVSADGEVYLRGHWLSQAEIDELCERIDARRKEEGAKDGTGTAGG